MYNLINLTLSRLLAYMKLSLAKDCYLTPVLVAVFASSAWALGLFSEREDLYASLVLTLRTPNMTLNLSSLIRCDTAGTTHSIPFLTRHRSLCRCRLRRGWRALFHGLRGEAAFSTTQEARGRSRRISPYRCPHPLRVVQPFTEADSQACKDSTLGRGQQAGAKVLVEEAEQDASLGPPI